MAGLSKTYSGDFTSFVAGKLLNAAGMAKAESDRRETDNLQKARPGSLFTKALQSEFGGDLYNRTLGNFDPRKSAEETDRKSSKEKRYQAQFGDLKKTPKSDLDDAEKELLKDDDSIPVKDVDARKGLTKLFGAGLDSKLILANARVAGLSNDVKSVNNDLVSTQKLIYDQNELLGSKFDQLLGIFSAQQDYQKKIVDEAQVKRREDELELEKDRSETRKLEKPDGGKKRGFNFSSLLGTVGDLLKGTRFKGKKAFQTAKDFISALGSPSLRKGAARTIGGVTRKLFRKSLYGERRDAFRDRLRSPFSKRASKTKLPKSARNLGVANAAMSDQLAQLGLMVSDPIEAFVDPKTKNPTDLVEDSIAKMTGKKAPTRITKKTSKAVQDRTVQKASKAIGGKVSGEIAEKAASKAAKKGITRLVPGVGTVIALGEAFMRAQEGDMTGAALSMLSAIPIVGWGVTAVDIARDLGYNPLGLPEAPPAYEKGTELTRPGSAILHGTEAVIGSKDRDNMMDSYQQSIDQVGSTLVSSAVSLANSVGQGQAVKSELKKSGLTFEIVNMPIASKIGGTSNLSVLSSLTDNFQREIFSKRKEEQEKDLKDEEPEDTEEDDSDSPENPDPSTPISSVSASPVRVDETGEPGADFTPAGSDNRAIYDGEIVEIGHQYNPNRMGGDRRQGAGYGTYVVVRSSHPEYGEFDGLYAHFPGKNSIVVKVGDKVKRGDILGPMATAAQYADPEMRPIVGSGTGPHTSLDFLKVGSAAKHPNWRELTRGIDPNFKTEPPKGEGGGGHRAKAFHELAKDEALSSLTPGVNDYVKPGGYSVISNTAWDTITDDTLLYPYDDGSGVPTIGYGSAAMRGITFGSSPITVRQAKAWLRDDINRITDGLSKNIKWWNSMTDNQRAGLIMFEYNAGEGNSYISSKGYPSLVRQLEKGNIRAAIEQIQRTGPAQSRIDVEKELLRSGPQQIVGPKIVGPKIVGEGRVGAGIPFFPDLTIMKGVKDGLDRGKQRERNEELLKLLPMLDNRPNDLQSSSQIMEDMEEDSMVQQVYIINNVAQTTTSPLVISSSGGSNNDYVDQYRMPSPA